MTVGMNTARMGRSDTPVRQCNATDPAWRGSKQAANDPWIQGGAALRESALVLKERGFSLAVTTANGGQLQPRVALASMLQALCYSLTLRFWAI